MKKIDLGQTVSVLANMGVIAGILLLAAELNQNNALIESQARSIQVQIRSDGWNQISQDPDLIALLVRDRNEEPLSEQEEIRLNAFWMGVLWRNQWAFQELGESTEWISPAIRQFRTYGSLQRTWEGGGSGAQSAGKDNFSAEFVRALEEHVLGRRAQRDQIRQ